MSEGQRVLLQLCVALVESGSSIADSLLILDEPENHLHPKVLIDVIKKIQELNINGQIWIATHSIPLISHFDPSSLWLIEDGETIYAGRKPESIIDCLVGDEGKERLNSFMNLPSVLASIKFACECLIPPSVINTGIEDPQTSQIKKILTKTFSLQKQIGVLDFGAGRGRLLKYLQQTKESGPSSDSFYEKLDYYAYDLPETSSEIQNECKSVISSYYNDKKNRYYSKKTDFPFESNIFDVVILCNVLHEIDPQEWLSLFSKNGLILPKLKNNGYLLIVEDQEIPIGEKAYKNGFMVMGKEEITILFNINKDNEYFVDDARNDGRLLAHLISKEKVASITHQSIISSIRNLKDRSLEKINEIKKYGSQNFKTGMKLGFWLNQYANSSLNLAQFGE